MCTYKQITKEQRIKLEALLKEGINKSQIARHLGIAKSSLYREIQRNRNVHGRYLAKQADELAMFRKERFKGHRTFSPSMHLLIEEKLTNQQWSPEQIVGYCRKQYIPMVSHERIYQFIYENKRRGGELYKHLRIYPTPYRKRYGSNRRRGPIAHRVSIDHRPAIVNARQRVGDWEVDTIYGADRKQALLTLVERKTRFTLLVKIPSTKAGITSHAIINELTPYKDFVRSITSDNGHEFARHKIIARKLHAQYFFTHPYSAWEKGTNENTNGLLRQYIPKKMDLSLLTPQSILTISDKLNNRHRKILHYSTPLKTFIANFNPPHSVALDS